MINLMIELMNIDDSLDLLKDFPFSISPDVNVLVPLQLLHGGIRGLGAPLGLCRRSSS